MTTRNLPSKILTATLSAAILMLAMVSHPTTVRAETGANPDYMHEMTHPDSEYNRAKAAQQAAPKSRGSGGAGDVGVIVPLVVVGGLLCLMIESCRNEMTSN